MTYRVCGMTFVVVLLLATLGQAQKFKDIYSFTGATDGANPWAAVLVDAAGNIYGTTVQGGSAGYGTVFKVDSGGKETVLHSFVGSDGDQPEGALIRDAWDAAGNIYGTTVYGGCCKDGTVFKLDSSGKQTVLHSFTGGTTDGCNTDIGLVEDRAGNFYGTTWGCGAYGYGTVFKVSKEGKETILYSFGGGSDGEFPHDGSLLIDKAGNLYGQTSGGGSSGYGVVYKVSQKGKETVLYTFAGGTTDGCYAYGPVTMDGAGNLYGTTIECGSYGAGVVWKLNQNGKEEVLHSFGGTDDGGAPSGGVVLDAAGDLYGDTEIGGDSSSDGVIFKLTEEGNETVLHRFSGTDGRDPVGGVFRDAKGNLYGTTLEGGRDGYGTVWSYVP